MSADPPIARDGGGSGRRPGLLVGVIAGVLVAAAGTLAWVLAFRLGQLAAALVAVAVGVAVGLALRSGRRGALAGVLAVVLTVAASVAGSNFAQRHQLIQGIDRLQQDWASLAVQSAPGGSAGDAPLVDDPACISSGIPPKEILAVLPPAALLCMSAKDLATVWKDVPEEKRAELPESARAEVEAILRGTPEEQLEASREAYDQAAYDIPDAVVACAPPPDITRATAAAGLGFPDGVPLFLPGADLFSADRKRGDGLEFDPPTQRCFVRENAREHPLEPISWLLAAVAAFAIPFGRRQAARPGR